MTDSPTYDWFGHISTPMKRKRPPISGAEIKRLANLNNKVREAYPMKRLGMGDVILLEDDEYMYNKMFDYFNPRDSEINYKSDFYFTAGDVGGYLLQNRLFRAGITFCDPEENNHKEYKIEDHERGIAGRPDLIMDYDRLKLFGKNTPLTGEELEKAIKALPEEIQWEVFEIKQAAVAWYKNWTECERLPEKYRCQLSLYIYYLLERGIIKSERGFFIILTRDSPENVRILEFPFDENLVKRAFAIADTFWQRVRNKDFPDVPGLPLISTDEVSQWIESPANEGREWHKLSGIENKEKITNDNSAHSLGG